MAHRIEVVVNPDAPLYPVGHTVARRRARDLAGFAVEPASARRPRIRL